MTTKRYLEQIKHYKKMIDNKLIDIYRMTSLACNMTVAPKQDVVQTSRGNDKIVNAVIKIVEYENDVNILVEELINKRKHIIEQIESLENMEYVEVLSFRFIGEMSFDDMPERLSMSRSKMFYIYKRALETFEQKYGHEYKTK